ncbi:stage II sporulation protein M, partial [Archaeoglobus sp.]
MKKLVAFSLAMFGFGVIISLCLLPQNSYGCLNYQKFETPGSIFFVRNNIYTIFLILSGSLLFGTTSFVNLVYNGMSFGAAVKWSLVCGMSINEILFLTLPHGIFEIPAIIIAGAAGFKIPCEIIRYLTGKKEQPLTKEDI